MKIGLFTYYRSNYGAALQAYALKEFLELTYNNVKVYMVDYYHDREYSIFETQSNSFFKRMVKKGFILLPYFEIKRRNNRHSIFNESYLNQERFLYQGGKEFDKLPEYDIYLTGSDQVFNINSNRYLLLFFQQFKRQGVQAAYAPSFGQSVFTKAERDRIKDLTKGFDYLSCREKDGAEMLSQVHGKDVPCVIDPTLLLTADQWNSMLKVPDTNDKYLLVYDLNGGVPMLNIARKVAADKGLKLYCITRHPDISFIYKGFDKVIFDAGPREFVGYFAKASYVITDSFHGTAFSITYRKPFNTYIALPKAGQRIYSLLDMCNLKNRIISEALTIETGESCYSNFDNSSFNEYRDSSISFLTRILSR